MSKLLAPHLWNIWNLIILSDSVLVLVMYSNIGTGAIALKIKSIALFLRIYFLIQPRIFKSVSFSKYLEAEIV